MHEQEDMNYFEEELHRLQALGEIPLMQRRLEQHSMDPIEELMEVYQDVKEIEANLSKAISIGTFILNKNKEVI